MMRLTLLRISLFALIAFSALPQKPKTPALESFDPVLLTEGKEVPGKDSISLEQGRFLYYFSSPETKAKFQADPQKYGIQLDGACARMGPPTGGNPDAYMVHKGRIYVFGSEECYRVFKTAPDKFLESEQPPPEWNPTDKTRAAGKAELEKLVAAMGGAKFDAVKSFNETRLVVSPMGERTMVRNTRFPDSYRIETQVGERTFGTLITAKGSYGMFGKPQVMPASFAKTAAAELQREPIPLLHSRFSSGFDVYQSADGVLHVKHEGLMSVVRTDPASHRLKSIGYRGRGMGGELGAVETLYDDYREVGGLQLPHSVTSSFEGQPNPARKWTVTAYELNPANIDARFTLP